MGQGCVFYVLASKGGKRLSSEFDGRNLLKLNILL